eukprot:ctg_1831.g621
MLLFVFGAPSFRSAGRTLVSRRTLAPVGHAVGAALRSRPLGRARQLIMAADPSATAASGGGASADPAMADDRRGQRIRLLRHPHHGDLPGPPGLAGGHHFDVGGNGRARQQSGSANRGRCRQGRVHGDARRRQTRPERPGGGAYEAVSDAGQGGHGVRYGHQTVPRVVYRSDRAAPQRPRSRRARVRRQLRLGRVHHGDGERTRSPQPGRRHHRAREVHGAEYHFCQPLQQCQLRGAAPRCVPRDQAGRPQAGQRQLRQPAQLYLLSADGALRRRGLVLSARADMQGNAV